MASGSKDDESAISKHVLEYYQQFSRNKHLPRYFSGTSLSYLPAIRGESDSEHEPQGNPLIINTGAEKGDTSRASSVLSNKKLEWDNGADIGYENCEARDLKRSSSLPNLLDFPKPDHASFEAEQSCSSASELKIIILDTSSEKSAGAVKPDSSTASSLCYEEKKLLSSSSSSSHTEKKVPHYSSSSSSKKDEKKVLKSSSHTTSSSARNILDFMGTLSYLKQKIGLPDAHSTPHEVSEQKHFLGQYLETPIMSTVPKPIRRLTENMEDLKNDNKSEDTKTVVKPNQKVVTLCLTKPISVECTEEQKHKIETVAVKQTTIGIQTEEISEKELIKIIARSQSSMNQSVVYYKHSDNKNESSSQTGSDPLGSNCDSFEYISGRNVTPRSKGGTERDAESEIVYVEVKKNVGQHQLGTLNASSDSLSSRNGIGNEEIERSIHLIQKLMKSKKYDPTTKKRYIKKLIKKISESKFMEESSTSSELFFPKKFEIPKKPQHNTPSTETSSEPLQKTSLHPTDFSCISANKPPTLSPRKKTSETNIFYQDSHKSSPRKKDSQSKMSYQDIQECLKLPAKRKSSKSNACYQDIQPTENLTSPTEIIPVDARDMRKNVFTLTNNEFSINKDTESSKSKNSDNASLEKHYESASSQKSYQDWKNDKTISERIFEEVRFVGDGDYLTNWASKERAYQINWINNEICHLGKLKNLLENIPSPPGESGTSNGSRSTGSQRITSVYQVSQENFVPGENKPKKYVIETQFDPKDGEPRGYFLDGKKYLVEEGNMASRARQVLGDIEVLSSDTTMNIKVTTFCEFCKRSPCVCDTESKNKASSAQTNKENRQVVNSSEICITCHTAPCICRKNSGAIPRRCTECNLYPCGCAVRKDSYSGHFIPAKGSSINPPQNKSCKKCGETEQYNSLKRVFENCSCTSTKCTCDFVEKLLKHFDVGQSRPVQHLNKPIFTCKDEKVQAHPDVKSGGLQTLIIGEDKYLQTDKKVHFLNLTPQRDVASQPSGMDNRHCGNKINQTNRRELGDEDEETGTDGVTLTENLTQTDGIQNISREIQSEQVETIVAKIQTDCSAFNLKDEAVNTVPKPNTYHTGTQSEIIKVPNEAIDVNGKTPLYTDVETMIKPESFDMESQSGRREVADKETLVYTPESVNYELIMVEPAPLYAPPVLKEIQDEAVNTTPRLENLRNNTQSTGRSETNVRDAGVNNNQIRGGKAKASFQFPESEKMSKCQAINVIHESSTRASQTNRTEQEFQTQTEKKPVVNKAQATSSCQHIAQTQTKDMMESTAKTTQATQSSQRTVHAVQVPQERQQGVQAQMLETTMKRTRAVQAPQEQEQETQAQISQDFSTRGIQAANIGQRVTQAVQASQAREHSVQAQAKSTQARYSNQRITQSAQSPQVHDYNVQACLCQDFAEKKSQISSLIENQEPRDTIARTIQTDAGQQYVQTQTQNMLDLSVKATQPSEGYQQDAQIQTIGIKDRVSKVVQAEKHQTIGQSQTEELRVSLSMGIQPIQNFLKVGETQTAGTRDSASKIVQAEKHKNIGQSQTEEQSVTSATKTQTGAVGAPVHRDIQSTREYQKARQTQTSEDRHTSPKESQAYGGQKSVNTQTQPKGSLLKDTKATMHTDVKVQANTYPKTSSAGKKIKFVGSDSEVDKLRSELKNVGCMCACGSGKVQDTSSEGSERVFRRVKTMKNKRTETDRGRGRVMIVEDTRSEPELTGRRRTTMKNRSVETDKQWATVGTCRCGFTDRIYLKDEGLQIGSKNIPEEVSYRNFSTSSNGTTESTTITSTPPSYTISPSLLTCVCCDRRTTSDNVSVFTNNSKEYFLCCSCVKKKPILTSICYTGPDKQSLTSSMQGPSSTFTRTESAGEFCTCIKPYRPKNSDYCSHCRNRLRKTTKSKGGIAYTLTLECESPKKFKVKKRRKKPLEEIRVKVPCPYNRKKYKDRENLQRKSSFDTKAGLSSDKNDSADTNKSDNTNSINHTESRSTNGTYKIYSSTGDSKEEKSKRSSTLQEYLKLNRPDFIDSAEYRRNIVNNSKVDRIKNKDEIKLRFFEENMNTTDPNIKTRLFSEREMKEITKRNYKKLPEVKQRAVHYKETRLKSADRFIKDLMAKKIQGSVLRGKRNFPIDKYVINLKK